LSPARPAVQTVQTGRQKLLTRVDAKRAVTMAISNTYVRESLVDMVRDTIMEVADEDLTISEFLPS